MPGGQDKKRSRSEEQLLSPQCHGLLESRGPRAQHQPCPSIVTRSFAFVKLKVSGQPSLVYLRPCANPGRSVQSRRATMTTCPAPNQPCAPPTPSGGRGRGGKGENPTGQKQRNEAGTGHGGGRHLSTPPRPAPAAPYNGTGPPHQIAPRDQDGEGENETWREMYALSGDKLRSTFKKTAHRYAERQGTRERTKRPH